MQLSDNPTVQKEQLAELVRVSARKLSELKAPVQIFHPSEIRESLMSVYGHIGRDGNYYTIPQCRFAKLNLGYRTSYDSTADG